MCGCRCLGGQISQSISSQIDLGSLDFQSSNSSSWPQLLGKNPFDAELL